MSVQPALLDHAFYRAWIKGEVAPATLAAYHGSYREFISRVPGYWQRVVGAFQPEFPGEHPVVSEERRHVLLWERWGQRLPAPGDVPRPGALLDSLDKMTPSQLLGALQAFEIQQPEVARTKKEGMLKHYGFAEDDLLYFDEHQNEESHIAYGRWLAGRYADAREYDEGFARGAELVHAGLDPFVAH